MADLRVLKTPSDASKERIVALLEETLAEAKRGNVVGVFLYTEDAEGRVTHSRDGMSDSLIIFWLELVKRRILEAYA